MGIQKAIHGLPDWPVFGKTIRPPNRFGTANGLHAERPHRRNDKKQAANDVVHGLFGFLDRG